jgi:hypothetical protein
MRAARKSGAVWSEVLDLVMILMAFFCKIVFLFRADYDEMLIYFRVVDPDPTGYIIICNLGSGSIILFFFFFFVLVRAFFYFLCTVSGCDGGNRTRNIAVYTWRFSLLSY